MIMGRGEASSIKAPLLVERGLVFDSINLQKNYSLDYRYFLCPRHGCVAQSL